MAAIVPASLCAVVALDEGFTHAHLDRDNSELYEANPVPEQPESFGTRAYARLMATGTADREEIYKVKVAKEGQPLGGTAGGTFLWGAKDEPDEEYKGWLSYNKVTGFSHLRFFQGTLSTWETYEGYRFPDAVSLPNHKVVTVYDNQQDDEIWCSVLDPATEAVSSSIVAEKGSPDFSMPSIARLPGGRLLCFYTLLTYTRGSDTYLTIGFSYSDDEGASWSEGGQHAYGFRSKVWTSDDILRKFRVRHHGGFLTGQLVTYNTSTTEYCEWHLLSRDLGASWTVVEEELDTITPLVFDAAWDLVGLDDGRVMLVTRRSTGVATLDRYVKSTPGQAWDDDPTSTSIDGSTHYSPAGDSFVGAGQTEEGDVYVLFAQDGAASRIALRKLDPTTLLNVTDEDETLYYKEGLTTSGENEPIDLNDNAATAGVSNMCPVSFKGSLLLVHGSAAGHDTNKSISATRLGGYSNVTWESQTFGFRDDASGVQVGVLYLPLDFPADYSGAWTVGTSGAPPTPTLTVDGLNISASTVGAYQLSRSSTAGLPCLYYARVRVDGVHSFNATGHGCKIYMGDGVNRSQVDLRISNTSARLHDVVAAADLETFVLEDGEYYDWYVSAESGRIQAFFRKVGELNFTLGIVHTPATTANASGNRIEWGLVSDITGTSTSHWLAVGASQLDTVATRLPAAGYSRPDDLLGRPASTRLCWLDEGERISVVGGSFYRGNGWQIGVRYEDGIHLVDPTLHPSPSVPYRSTRNDVEHILRWTPAEGAARTRPLSSSVGVYLGRPNFPVAYFEGSQDGTNWIGIATADARTGLTGLSYTRSGYYVTPDTGTVHAGTRYVQLEELVGGYIVFDVDGSHGGPYTRKITSNSEGAWTDQETRRVQLHFEGDLTGIPTSGDCEIIAPQVLAVGHQNANGYNYYRLRIPAFDTAEGWMQLGVCLVGPLVVFGIPPDWGETLGAEPIGEIRTAENGQRRGRKLGPLRRYATLPWPGGWPTHGLANAAPDWISSIVDIGGMPIGIRYDASIPEGLLARTQGGVLPCVYARDLDLSTESVISFSYPGRDQSLYSRVMGEVSRQVMVRRGTTGPVYTLSAVRLEEEV